MVFVFDTEAFENFKDNEGKFKECLIHDVQGNLSLYEAAYLGIRGEDILDEAIDFTTRNLQSGLTHLSSQLRDQVTHALNRPIRKCLPRLDARHYIAGYSEDESHNETLLKLAKLDFNIIQKLHQEELKIITEYVQYFPTIIRLDPKHCSHFFQFLACYFSERNSEPK